MTEQEIWDCETPISELLNCDVPRWIESDITANTVIAICQGGCASGAYMPAVTYHIAMRDMGEHGDYVLDYIMDSLGDVPPPDKNESWSGISCFYLSTAIELWAMDILQQLQALESEAE